ncbi:transcriptional regulator with XRE-family HTH domain [Lipingzhangella halophila]|uniref:Transcriptional regulator with XRE-family HTH domain n=1 Tax=Lipingzhangella halophila TaxID=1783352 RepID=A0A7W7RI02_9ACTN|nr:helix-turn-helix transcriptional regulator [Lipingzhangella halophila]MBB4931943.1 transcriptional regulator with XRE-family HTH domain [Lipingzhangella halophila]
MTTLNTRPVGALLRDHRIRGRLSQLDLAVQAGVSSRHLSFVENGRTRPSREMILKLAEHLDVPLRDRNQLLLAGGYAPAYPEHSLRSPEMAPVRAAVRQVLAAHEPYPALTVDRLYNIIDFNSAAGTLLSEGVSPALLASPANSLRISLHPEGFAPRIANLGEWRAHLLRRLHRQVEQTGDGELGALYEELLALPCEQEEPEVELPGPGDVVVPMRLRYQERELVFFSTLAVIGTPLDVTASEIVVESFFPADSATADFLTRHARAAR